MKTTEETSKSIQELLGMLKDNPQDQKALNLLGRRCLDKAQCIAISRKYHQSGIDHDFVVNEACYKMLQWVIKGGKVKSECHFYALLTTILQNRYRDAWRTEKTLKNKPNWKIFSFGDIENKDDNIITDHHGNRWRNISNPGRRLSDEWLDNQDEAIISETKIDKDEWLDNRDEAIILGSKEDEILTDIYFCLNDHLKNTHYSIFMDKTTKGLSSTEVANKYNTTPNNVDQICSRGLQYLRRNAARFNPAA